MDIPLRFLLKGPDEESCGPFDPLSIFRRAVQHEVGWSDVRAITRMGDRIYVLLYLPDSKFPGHWNWKCGFFTIVEGIGGRLILDVSKIHLFPGLVRDSVQKDRTQFRRLCKTFSRTAMVDTYQIYAPCEPSAFDDFTRRSSLLMLFDEGRATSLR